MNNQANTKLSIIVPVYNVKQYISKCIDSITSQADNQCEILLIDDGSNDGSDKVCDELAEKCRIIKTFHKQNGGLSDARNFGIEHACGEYLMFVDSDDYLEKNSLKQIIEKLDETDCDVLTAKSYSVDENGITKDEVEYSIKEGLYSSGDFLKTLYKNRNSILFCAQYFICKKELVSRHKLSFKKGIIHEDELWTPQLLLVSNSIYYLDQYFYYHLMRENSIMHSDNDKKSGESLLFIAKELNAIYKKTNEYKYLRNRMAIFYLQAFPKLGMTSVKQFDRKFAFKNSSYSDVKLKSLLFMISPKIYLRFWNKKYK